MGINSGFAFVVQMGVNHGRNQIVSRADGVDVACQVQIEVFHRHDLTVAAACCAAFDAKGWPLRRLAQGDNPAFADVLHRLSKPNCRGGFAFAQGGRGNGRHIHVFGVRAIF